MRIQLSMKPLDNECGVMNLGTQKVNGTHWTCSHKENKIWLWVDAFNRIWKLCQV